MLEYFFVILVVLLPFLTFHFEKHYRRHFFMLPLFVMFQPTLKHTSTNTYAKDPAINTRDGKGTAR